MTHFVREKSIARSDLYRDLRSYFFDQDVLEVDVPLLGRGGSTDVHLASMAIEAPSQGRYLQTSPEFFMKRLLALGSGDIFAICKAFRKEEAGRVHNPEFSMLEWYRLGFRLEDLIEDVLRLFSRLGTLPAVTRFTYRDLFIKEVGVDPHTSTEAALRDAAGSELVGLLTKAELLDYFMATRIEPGLPEGLAVITEFPATQAALAKTAMSSDVEVACRFEIYWDGLELANGYEELTDPSEQRRRFDRDNKQRAKLGMELIAPDEEYLGALDRGLPECAGVAVGLDRLLMCLEGKDHIRDVMLFPEDCL